ncbi:hypothetical protein THAOC_21612, partial [Thalassiosira oceanica]
MLASLPQEIERDLACHRGRLLLQTRGSRRAPFFFCLFCFEQTGRAFSMMKQCGDNEQGDKAGIGKKDKDCTGRTQTGRQDRDEGRDGQTPPDTKRKLHVKTKMDSDDYACAGAHGTIAPQLDEAYYDDRSDASD